MTRARLNLLAAMIGLTAPMLLGCGSADASFQWRNVTIAGHARCLPVAYTQADQEQGLMGVKHVVRPMVFAYSPPSTPSFWMKDTPAPLTGLWVGAGGHVIGFWHGRPESTSLHPAPAPISAVIEYPASARVPPRGARFAIGPRCTAPDRRL
jgi:uncharacterized membrane protein (UPF0127 family)